MDMTGVRLTELVEAAGCAAKIAPGALAKVLGNLPRTEDPNLLVGFDASDDACVYDLGDGRGLVQTCDFFPPMVDDPFLFGQVAAANALSDVYAMGGEPKLALNLLCFPNCLGIEVAGQILAGGADRCQLAGCVVAGGHSINDHEPKYGLSVTGFVQLDGLLANAGAKVGDALVLTKALGTGIITTAYKGGLLDEAGVRVATDSIDPPERHCRPRGRRHRPPRLHRRHGLLAHGPLLRDGRGLGRHAPDRRRRGARA